MQKKVDNPFKKRKYDKYHIFWIAGAVALLT